MLGDMKNQKTQVFVSYSRKNSDFVEALINDLNAGNFEPLVDTRDIMPGEAWRERLRDMISAADAVIFCLSPQFEASEVCAWEVEEALAQGKRLLPMVIDKAFVGDGFPALKRLNYFFVAGPADVTGQFPSIATALEIDIDWVREHTRLGRLAADWLKGERHADLLLSRTELAAARDWLTREPEKRGETAQPRPTEEIRSLIEASERCLRTRRRRWATAIGLLVAGAGAGTFAYHDYTREKVEYFAEINRAPLTPHFTTPFSAATAQGRRQHEVYRVTSSRRRVTGYQCETSFGMPKTCEGQLHSRLAISHSDDGPSKFEWVDLRNQTIRSMTYAAKDRIGVLERNSIVEIDPCRVGQTLWSDPIMGSTNVARYRFIFDAEGRRIETHYLNGYGLPTLDANGSAGRRVEYDEAGRVAREIMLNAKLRPSPDNNGLVEMRFEYDGATLTQRRLGVGELPVEGGSDHHRITQVRDDHGNLIGERTFDRWGAAKGNRCNIDVTMTQWTYDEFGRRASERYFDQRGAPFPKGSEQRLGNIYSYGVPSPTIEVRTKQQIFPPDSHTGSMENETQDLGQILRSKMRQPDMVETLDLLARSQTHAFVTADGAPATHIDQVHKTVESWSTDGSLTEIATFDAAGKSVAARGYALRKSLRDRRGSLVREEYYDVSGKPARNASGYATLVREVNTSGQTMVETFLDENERPVDAEEGYSRVEYAYNQLGLPASTKFFDAAGKKAESRNGHETRIVYNEAGQKTRITDFRADGSLVNDLEQLSTMTRPAVTCVRVSSTERAYGAMARAEV